MPDKLFDKKVSLIMPAYNEAPYLKDSISETIKTMQVYSDDFEIIILDDGSKDDTGAIAEELAHNYPNIIFKANTQNYGKGRALKKGFRYTSGDYIVFLDSDLDLHPDQLKLYVSRMHDENVDVVIGSKRHPESKIDYPWHRKIVSFVYFWLIKIIFGLPIHDTQTGLKLFKREVLQKVFPKVLIKRFAYDLELLVLAHYFGYKIAESPVVVKFNRSLGSRIRVKCIWQTLIDTLAIFYRLHVIKWYDKS